MQLRKQLTNTQQIVKDNALRFFTSNHAATFLGSLEQNEELKKMVANLKIDIELLQEDFVELSKYKKNMLKKQETLPGFFFENALLRKDRKIKCYQEEITRFRKRTVLLLDKFLDNSLCEDDFY